MAIRRVHVPKVEPGVIALTEREARHVRDVLRMSADDSVEVFDDAGAVAMGKLVAVDPQQVSVAVDRVSSHDAHFELIVAAAVPKGDRADWMIEKLSELGVSRFVPLQTERSVVLPQGRNKIDRWARIATEAAKQSHRAGVMRIDPLTPLEAAIEQVVTRASSPARESLARARTPVSRGVVLSTAPHATSIIQAFPSSVLDPPSSLALFIGPEGGWTETELDRMIEAGLTPARLTETILRVETAAVAAAAVVATVLDSRASDSSPATP